MEVGGVSHRFVDADTAEAAQAEVTEALIAALDLRVAAANKTLTKKYDASGPIQKCQLIAAMDGLTTPATESEGRRARRRLARLIRYNMERRACFQQFLPTKPVSPDALDAMILRGEIQNIERNLGRLREWMLRDPFHS